MTVLIFILLAVMPALVIVAGLKDLTTMKIPNWISGVLVIAFFPAALATGLPLQQILIHVGLAVAVLLVGMVIFALRWLGGGDVKLMSATCLWLGLTASGLFGVYTALVGGLFGLTLLLARQHIGPFLPSSLGWVSTLMEPKGDIPYGIAIAIGALLAYPSSPLILAALAR
ncbi:MAG: pilus assembly protein CpaA [Brevundimonas sp.]|nr:MAG: pilus assembly protein CpaA [Brevundimonas sp.]